MFVSYFILAKDCNFNLKKSEPVIKNVNDEVIIG